MERALIVVVLLAVFCQCQGQNGQNANIVIDPATLDPQEAGSDVNMQCTCPTSDCGELQWHHNGMPVTDGEGGAIITDVEAGDEIVSMLTLEGVTDDSKGKYRCSDPENFFDQAEVELDVVAAGDDAEDDDDDDSEKPGDDATTNVGVGETIDLECTGAPGVMIVWYRDDTLLEETDGYILTSAVDSASGKATSMLTKEDATEEDSGRYTCRNGDDQSEIAAHTVEVSGAGHVRAAMFVTCSAVAVALSAILF